MRARTCYISQQTPTYALTSAGTTDESEIVEASNLVLERGSCVTKLGRAVLVVSSCQDNLDAVVHVAE